LHFRMPGAYITGRVMAMTRRHNIGRAEDLEAARKASDG